MFGKVFKIIVCVVLLIAAAGGVCAYKAHEARYAEYWGLEIDVQSTQLDLRDLPYTVEELLTLSERMEYVTDLELGQIEMTAEELSEIRAAYPNAKLSYTVELFGNVYTPDTTFPSWRCFRR